MESILKKAIGELFDGVFAITLKTINHTFEKDTDTALYCVEHFVYEIIYGTGNTAVIEVKKYEKELKNSSFIDIYETNTIHEEGEKLLSSKIYNHLTHDWNSGQNTASIGATG